MTAEAQLQTDYNNKKDIKVYLSDRFKAYRDSMNLLCE